MTVRVEGLSELEAKLKQLGPTLGPAALSLALVDAAQPTVEAARALAPMDPNRKKKGKHMRDAITAAPRLKKAQLRYAEDATARAFIGVGRRGPQGHLIEFGHDIVARGAGKDHGAMKAELKAHMAAGGKRRKFKSKIERRSGKGGPAIGRAVAKPFMRPAWDATKMQVLQRFSERVWEMLVAVARGASSAAAAGNLNKRAAKSIQQGGD